MAVTSQTIEQGDRNVVMHFTNDGDAESAVTKVDVSALAPACDRVAILKIKYTTNTTGGTGPTGVNLLWTATSGNTLIETLPPNSSDDLDFREFGGLQNPKNAGYSGDIAFTCSANDAYSITLWMKKKYA